MKLTVEQTQGLPFPVGCPVWYNFPETPSGENEEPPILKRGVVESASFNYASRAIIYEVIYKDDCPSRKDIIEEVSEDQLAYGSNCPVIIEANEGRPVSEGTVLFCEPSSVDIGKFIYTVMIFMEGSEARYECGIDAEHIKYRKVNTVNAKIANKAEDAAAESVSKKQPSAANNSNGHHLAKIAASAPAVHNPDGKEAVPSSITCNSADKSKRKAGGLDDSSNRSTHQQQQPCKLISDSTANKKMRVDTSSSLANNDDACKEGNLRSTVSYSNDSVGGSKDNAHGTNHGTRMDMSVPLWLQRNRKSQEDLFFHLIGSKRFDKRGQRATVKSIGRETNTGIRVNSNHRETNHPLAPIIITVDAFSDRDGVCLRDLTEARRKLQELLLDYVGNDGSRGRLIYELALSCWGAHRPKKSTCNAVNARDPFDGDSGCRFITVLALPYHFNGGRRVYHAAQLLKANVLARIRNEANSYIKVVGDEFRVPVKFCDPYVLVVGSCYQDVDKAAEIVRGATDNHVQYCSLKLLF
mmetsp:Transcript_30476/g.56297  ORF Transcript_30476/g.56297 Transcript_30476/m.56297 type:complete len:525 (+) Transcript_30476:104-1678(+)